MFYPFYAKQKCIIKSMWEEKQSDKTKEQELKGKIHPVISRLVAQRTIDDFDSFLDPEYKKLDHPYALNDVEKGAKIFIEIAKSKGSVAFISDYDCDGVFSSVMIKELCSAFNLKCNGILPSRFKHGYGLSEKLIKDFKEKYKENVPDLLFVLDCGSNNYEEIKALKEFGVKKIILIDHHLIDEKIKSSNVDAFISWHLSESMHEMCTCGQIFQFIRGIRLKTKHIEPIQFLSYAAIGTIADVMPVIKNNRIIIKNGLTEYSFKHIVAFGLTTLIQHSKLKKDYITKEDIAFKVAPKINAVGRLDDPTIAYRFLIEKDKNMAEKMVKEITLYNDKRKKQQKYIEKAIESISADEKYGILIYNEKWNVGVVGISASKIVEKYNKPAIVLGNLDGKWKGSGRSVEGINIKEVLDGCSEMFEKYGGHSGAVGLTLKEEYLEKAQEMFNQACKEYIEKNEPEEPKKYFDAQLKCKAINIDIAEQISKYMPPYCNQNNPEPIFKLSNVTIREVFIKENPAWQLIKFKVEKNDRMIDYGFKIFSKKWGGEIEGKTCDLYFSFPQKIIDDYGNFELEIQDIEIKEKI
jgi:single-stranded-DNA-specific exonuclease